MNKLEQIVAMVNVVMLSVFVLNIIILSCLLNVIMLHGKNSVHLCIGLAYKKEWVNLLQKEWLDPLRASKSIMYILDILQNDGVHALPPYN